MIILGINAYHGDAAAAIIKDGKLIAAVEEERFNRFKHCAGFPIESIKYCLLTAGVTIEDVDHVGISRDPSAHLHKKVLFAATRAAKQAVGGRRQEAVGTIDDEDVGGASEVLVVIWTAGGTTWLLYNRSRELTGSPLPVLRPTASQRIQCELTKLVRSRWAFMLRRFSCGSPKKP